MCWHFGIDGRVQMSFHMLRRHGYNRGWYSKAVTVIFRRVETEFCMLHMVTMLASRTSARPTKPILRTRAVNHAAHVWLLLAFVTAQLQQQSVVLVDAQLLGSLFGFLAGKCRGSDAKRCGIGNLGYAVRSGTDGTDNCRELCVYVVVLQSNIACGATCSPIDFNGTTTVSPASAPTPLSSFDVTLDLDGVPFLDRSRFQAAASRWERIITQDLSDINAVDLPNPPRYDTCRYPSPVIDDLYICAAYVTKDGVGGTLGFATVGFVRSVDGLPITGTMSFDSADITALRSNGDLDVVLLHEIGHLLGTYDMCVCWTCVVWVVVSIMFCGDQPSLSTLYIYYIAYCATLFFMYRHWDSVGGTGRDGNRRAKLPLSRRQGHGGIPRHFGLQDLTDRTRYTRRYWLALFAL
jgi:hypothetical protein